MTNKIASAFFDILYKSMMDLKKIKLINYSKYFALHSIDSYSIHLSLQHDFSMLIRKIFELAHISSFTAHESVCKRVHL